MSHPEFEVVIVTRGEHLTGVLAGLVPHAPFPLRLISKRWPSDDQTLLLLETLCRMGCDVAVERQHDSGIGTARAQAAESRYPVVVCLDDDAVLVPAGALGRLAEGATRHPFATPVIRFAQNFLEQVLPGHTEIWEPVSRDDPRVKRALEARGEGWARVYELGEEQRTDQLGGTCYAVETNRYRAVAEKLVGWKIGGSDRYLGHLLGEGVVLSDVYCYHFGRYSYEKWGLGNVERRLLADDPERFREHAIKACPAL